MSSALAAGLLLFAVIFTRADWSALFAPRTFELLLDIGARLWPPALTGVGLLTLVKLAGQSLAISVIAIAIAVTAGALASVAAARTIALGTVFGPARPAAKAQRDSSAAPRNDTPAGATRHTLTGTGWLIGSRALLLVTRAIPAPVWALLCMFVLFPGPLPGAIALGVHTFGILGRLLAETIESLDARPIQALTSAGASRAQALFYGVLPAGAGQGLAYALYRWEVSVRDTVAIGVVGAGGLGQLLNEQLSNFDYAGLVVTIATLIIVTLLIDALSAVMRRGIRTTV